MAGCESGASSGSQAPFVTSELLRIGVADGFEELQFHRIRAARLIPGGGILVGNASTAEVRRFDPDGEWILSFGATGRGPGEHQNISGIWLAGDSLWVADHLLYRLTHWTLDGTHISTTAIPPGSDGPAAVRGRTSDGSLVVSSLVHGAIDGNRMQVDSVDLHLWDGKSREVDDVLGRFFSQVVHQYQEGIGVTGYPSALRAHGQVTAVGADIVVLDGNTGELLRIAPGRTDRIDLPIQDPVSVTDDHWRQYEEVWVGSVAEQWRPRLRSALREMTRPDHLPFASEMLGGLDGSIWIRTFRISPAEPNIWWWIPSRGDEPRRVILPPGFTPMDASGNRVLGVETDEFDVEQVVLVQVTLPD